MRTLGSAPARPGPTRARVSPAPTTGTRTRPTRRKAPLVVGPWPGSPAPTSVPRWRLVAILVTMAMLFAAIAVRLTEIQARSSRRYADLGLSQRMRTTKLPAQRGSIVDRNGAELALSLQAQTVWADPRLVTDKEAAARTLAPVLGLPVQNLSQRLAVEANFSYLARKVGDEVAAKVKALDIPGVFLLDEPRRFLPAGALAAPVLGLVGVDDQGLSGLEFQYRDYLTGKPGRLLQERDPAGREIPSGVRKAEPATEGRQLELTLDRAMQFETERVLSEQMVSSRAKGGIAIVMDPVTGEILAMANLVVDPGGKPRPSADNMAVTRVYEPGSVNKVVTLAAAVEEGTVDLQARMSVPDMLKVSDGVFRDAEAHSPGWWTVSEIMAESSNVGTIMIGQKLGKARIDQYLRAFGLARPTGLGFPGESAGLLPDPEDWTGTSIGTISIGQGVAVTALQMLGAYNAIANDGVLVAPRLVQKVADETGRMRDVPAVPGRRVVSAATAQKMSAMLVGAVAKGTGTAAAVADYTVAGKTGTARKPRAGASGYTEGAYLATFVGFLPAESPRLSAIVVLDEPTPFYGGLVSAPVFASLGGYGVRRFQIAPGRASGGAPDAAVTVTTPHSLPSKPRETRAT